MPRPKSDGPTPAELQILKILWTQGPQTVRQVMPHLPNNPPRAYTTVMSLLNVMHEKGLVAREPKGRAFIYRPAAAEEQTLSTMVGDMVDRAFNGSAAALVAHLLEGAEPSEDELKEIRKTLSAYKKNKTS